MASFPKYNPLICGNYSPNFTAGAVPCTLQSVARVARARLLAGNTFFRSVQTAAFVDVNSINLNCTVTPLGIVGTVQSEQVDLIITDEFGVVNPTISIIQEIDLGSPTTCISHGPSLLRAALTGNPSVIMPPSDDGDGGSGWSIVGPTPPNLEPCFIIPFNANLSGGIGLPPGGDGSSIRTGPTFTLMHIQEAETGPAGEIDINVNEISEWDGTQWIAHPSSLHNVAIDAQGNIIAPHPDCPNPPIA